MAYSHTVTFMAESHTDGYLTPSDLAESGAFPCVQCSGISRRGGYAPSNCQVVNTASARGCRGRDCRGQRMTTPDPEAGWGTVPVDSRIHMATEGVDLDAMFAAIDAAEAVSA